MTNLPTSDIDGQVQQILRVVDAGAEYVRITTPTLADVKCFATISRKLAAAGCRVPLIADVHFSPKVATAAAKVAAKVRINPGNFLKFNHTGNPDALQNTYLDALHSIMRPLLDVCRQEGTVLRIGTNHGSLSERILDLYGDTPEGMVEATLESVRICRAENFHDIVLSLKSSNVKVMVEATRLLVRRMGNEGMDYPLHLGVTEAGEGEDGRLKSAIGIGSLLVDGIGDTIRVSLTEDPESEIPVAYGILQASRSRLTRNEYISCPGCGRTTFRLQEAVRKVKEATAGFTGLKIAIMGCIVNGPGEMADADFGYVGAGPGKVHLYRGMEAVLKNVDEDEAVEKLLEIIKIK
jgi:(E)-4-hydroxy-3-methylbut-2-enyl-diphosphate synthase